jgi:hypothetical protein
MPTSGLYGPYELTTQNIDAVVRGVGPGAYVRYEDGEAIHTNSAEGYFSIFKRGMRGVYQHCKEKHLHRYLAEYDFRYNHRIALGFNDGERAALAVKNAAGKRLTYRGTH